MADLLTAQHLAKSYRCGRMVLQDATLQIATGEIVAVTGRSGEGKSTLARILCGHSAPTGGTAALLGQPLWGARGYNVALRPAIQLIAQQPLGSLDPHQRVLEAVAEPLRYHRLAPDWAAARAAAAALLQTVWLDDTVHDRLPHQLSGGQAQRVAIARALAVRPQLLIADEATAMLDILAQAQVVALLREQAAQGLAVLLISHDLALVQAVAHRCYHLTDGKLTEIKGENIQ